MSGKGKAKVADDVIWHDFSSMKRHLALGNDEKELAVLASGEPWKEMDLESLRESYETIKDNLVFFLGGFAAKKHIMSMMIVLRQPNGGEEIDDQDDGKEGDEGEDDEGEDAVEVNAPAPQPNKSTFGSDQVVESNHNRTTQQGESDRTSSDNPDEQESGSEPRNDTTNVPGEAPEECRKLIVIATYYFPKSDPTDWSQESILTKPIALRDIRVGKEFAEAVAMWQETEPPNSTDLLQFLVDCSQNKHLRRIFWGLEGPSSGEGESTVQMLVPDHVVSLSNEAETELGAPPLEPDDASSNSDQVGLGGLTFEKAMMIVTKHEELKISKADDDVAKVKARSKMWIPIIMKIFDKHHCTKPTFVDFQEVQSTFRPWQKAHLKIIRTKLNSELSPQLREAHAVVLFSTIIQRHETRMLKVCGSQGINKALKCSKRSKLVIAAIEKSAIVGKDIISGVRLNELINSPTAAVKIKESNKRTNERRKNPKEKGQDDNRGAVSDEEKLLAGCTFLGDIEGDTDEEDVTRFETDEVEFDSEVD
jgi:hypothetical protein